MGYEQKAPDARLPRGGCIRDFGDEMELQKNKTGNHSLTCIESKTDTGLFPRRGGTAFERETTAV